MLETITLDQLQPLDRAQITLVAWDDLAEGEAKRLRALGIDTGARVEIAHRGVFAGRDPIALMVGRSLVAIRRVHARAMQVERL